MTAPHALLPLIVADIFELAGLSRHRGEQIARGARQTQARWQVLSAASDPLRSVPQIARRLGVSRQNVQRIADALVGDRLAEFVANPDHRTSPHLQLTENGRATLVTITDLANAHHAALTPRLGGLDLERLHADLRLLLAALRSQYESSGDADDDT